MYDNTEGNTDLQLLISRYGGGSSDISLLKLSGVDKKIKLRDMKMTYQFT